MDEGEGTMTQKQTRPGKPEPSRFAVDAAGVEPMRLVTTSDGLTEAERRDNSAYDEALRRITRPIPPAV